jgi:hypothetical protein
VAGLPPAKQTSAAATPAPYSGSAFAQLTMWRSWMWTAAPREQIARLLIVIGRS